MNLFDSAHILSSLGQLAVFGAALIIYLETATILGSILPGDSLLFLLGLGLATYLTEFNIIAAIAIVFVAAVAGSQTGFALGHKFGPRLFKNTSTFFFNQKTVARTQQFFDRFGPRSIVIARFVPILRALIPMFAAIAHFDARKFFLLNLLGGFIWTAGLMGAGYFLGNIEFVRQNVEAFVIGFVILSSLALPVEMLREKFKRK